MAEHDARLWRAIRARDAAGVRSALDAGADPDGREPASGLTPLMAAAGRVDRDSARLLLDAGADVNAVDSGAGATALHKACQGGDAGMAADLLAAGAFTDSVVPGTGHTPLMEAMWFKQPDIVGLLLDHGAGVNLATHYGFSMAEHLDYEIGVNTVGKDRLIRADELIKRWREETNQVLADHPLLAATAAGETEVVAGLLAEGAEVDVRYPRVNGFNDGHTPLLVAARDGHSEIVRLLLAAGADVNAVEPVFGAVPLHKAVYNGRADITTALVEVSGVNLDFQGATNGYTPLHDALWHGYEGCSWTLTEAGARLDLEGHDGKRPVDLAVEVFGAGHPLTERLERD